MKVMSSRKSHRDKSVMDNGYGEFIRMLEYKQEHKGHFLIMVSKWYPLSQICHCCVYKNPEVKDLKIRKWTCPVCGTQHNRDINAAINIKNEGLRILASA